MEDLKLNIEIGGILKNELLKKITDAGVLLNEYANVIFSNDLFQTSKTKMQVSIIEVSIEQLGFLQGATNLEIRDRIKELGLSECPLEVAPYLRLYLMDQQEMENNLSLKNQSPLDALTIFSKPIIDEDQFPKGFYVRKISGKLWLRGYVCPNDYIWKPYDKMVFKVG